MSVALLLCMNEGISRKVKKNLERVRKEGKDRVLSEAIIRG